MNKFLKIIAGLLVGLALAGAVGVGYLYFLGGGTVAVPEAVREWFPSASDTAPGPQTGDPGAVAGEEVPTSEQTPGPLRRIFRNATAGIALLEGETLRVRFVERETGNVYEADATGENLVRLSNTTIPRIQEAYFTANGESVALRYLADDHHTIETFVGTLADTSGGETEAQLAGAFFPQNVLSLTASPAGNSFFYLTEDEGGEGFVQTTQGSTAESVFSSSISEWNARWVSEGTIALLTQPSGEVPGYLYRLNPATESLTRLLGNVHGLTTNLRADGGLVLFSESVDRTIRFSMMDLQNSKVTSLPVVTLPEKCVWAGSESSVIYCGIPREFPAAAYPDAWYRGEFFFTDDLWVIDTKHGTAETLVNLSQLSDQNIDLIDPQLSADERFLIFRNKKDGSLWSFELVQQ